MSRAHTSKIIYISSKGQRITDEIWNLSNILCLWFFVNKLQNKLKRVDKSSLMRYILTTYYIFIPVFTQIVDKWKPNNHISGKIYEDNWLSVWPRSSSGAIAVTHPVLYAALLWFKSLAPGKFELHFRLVIFQMDFSNSWLRNLFVKLP